ncbi:MAG TPA: hypothetical protein VGF63_01625 [Solirubrobacteraceae bacterium]|jgi:hypothetical protein
MATSGTTRAPRRPGPATAPKVATCPWRLAATATAAVALVLVLGACGTTPPKRGAGGAIDTTGKTRLLHLRTGDCVADMQHSIDNPDGGHNGVPLVTAVPCADLHDAQVLLVSPLGGGAWPGEVIVGGEVARGMQTLQKRLVRLSEADPHHQLHLFAFRPSQERWEFEKQHKIMFLVLYPNKQRGPAAA